MADKSNDSNNRDDSSRSHALTGYEFDFGPMAPNYAMQMSAWKLHPESDIDHRWKVAISKALTQADDLAFNGFISKAERDKIRAKVATKIRDLILS